MMEPEIIRVFDEFDARPPRIEHKAVSEQSRYVAQSRAVVEPLESHAPSTDAHSFEFRHLAPQIREREADMVHAGTLAPAHRDEDIEMDLHTAARDGVRALRNRLTLHVPLIPCDRFGRARDREVDMMIIRRAGHA